MPEKEENVPELSIVENDDNNNVELPNNDDDKSSAEEKIETKNETNNDVNGANSNEDTDSNSNNTLNNKNNNSNYSRASNSREAFERRLKDNNYYDKQKKNNQDKLNNIKKEREENNKKKEGANERLKKAKEKISGKTGDQVSKEDKNELKEANKENKQLEKKDKKLSKEEKKLIKENKSIEKDEKKAKVYGVLHPLEFLKSKLKTFFVIKVLPKLLIIILVVVVFCFILESVFEIFERADKVVRGVANFHERLDNFVNGFGFRDSEQAFYKEMDKLNKFYRNELDTKLLMATIFYDDIENSLDNTVETKFIASANSGDGIFQSGLALSYVKDVIRDSNETIGKNGVVYTSNKIYRLRRLARHQLKGNGKTATISLNDYIFDKVGSQLGASAIDIIKEAALMAVQIYFGLKNPNLWESVYETMFKDEKLLMTDTGAHIEQLGTDFLNIFKTLLGTFTDIEGVSFGFDSITSFVEELGSAVYELIIELDPLEAIKTINPLTWFDITYELDTLDEETYFKYLREEYIPEMPEFKKYLGGLDRGSEKYNRAVERIVKRIKEIRDDYDEYFGENEATAEFNRETCSGNIKSSLVGELVKPTSTSDTNITFNGDYSYGLVSGGIHQGIEINSHTTGNNEGDPVYSIYHHGRVEESTHDNSYECTNCKGGWIKISYDATIDDGEYKFYALYGGLDPNSISLSKGDTVEQGTIIGNIGNIENSNVDIPSLFFAVYDNSTSSYLNPTNMYIGCSDSISLVGDSNEEKIWFYLLQSGYNKYQAAAVLASVFHESSYAPNNLQNEANEKSGYSDEEFTAMVNSGQIGKDEFMASAKFDVEGEGKYGYGLAQWTSPDWKGEMYEHTKGQGLLIDDFEGQLKYMVEVIDDDATWSGHSNDRSIFQNVNSRDGVAAAANAYCLGYERPKKCNRGEKALELYDTYSDREIPQSNNSLDVITAKDVNNLDSSSANLKTVASFDNFLFLGDSRTGQLESELLGLGSNITVLGVGGSSAHNWSDTFTTNFAPFTYPGNDKTFVFPSSVSGISYAVGINSIDDGTTPNPKGGYWYNEIDKTKITLNRLLEHYPGVPIYVNSLIKYQSTYYSQGWGNGEIKASERNPMVDKYNAEIKKFCDLNNNLYFIDVSRGFSIDANSSDYYDGLHFTKTGINKYINNLKSIIISKQTNISNQNAVSTNNLNNFLFIGDSRYNGIRDSLKKLGSGINVAAVNSSTSAHWDKIINSGSGSVNDVSISLPSANNVSGISIMLGVNDLIPNDLKSVLTKLHKRYPNVRIYVNSIYHLASNYSYGDASNKNSSIDNFNKEIKNYCESNSSYLTYIDITSGLYDSNGYLSTSLSDDPEGIHIYSTRGQEKIVNNISNGIKNNLK